MAEGLREVRDELKKLRSELREFRVVRRTQFRWLLGGIAGTAVTVILSMFAKELLTR